MWQYRQSSSNKGDSLAHFGILGMHWGVRRFQNPDGTLTEEGKKRYGNTDSGSETKANERQKNEGKPLTKKQKENRRLVNQMVDHYKEAEKSHLEDAKNAKRNAKDLKKFGPDEPEQWLKKAFGNDWQDFQYMKDVWDIDDPLKFAKEESEKEYRYQLENAISNEKESKEAAKKCEELVEKWSNVDINHLSKAEMEELKEIDNYLRWWS